MSRVVKLPRAVSLAALVLASCLNLTACLSPTDSDSADISSTEGVFAGPSTPALNFDGFDPELIIEDSVFYNPGAMRVEDIRDFISRTNQGCVDGAEPCLANWRGETTTQPADDYCPSEFPYRAEADAAQVIFDAAQACGINPQVLLVTLQKEQSLLTASGARLTPARYSAAMGFGCPDGGQCNTQFAGFDKQVYFAARQFQRYRLDPGRYQFQADQVKYVNYSPRAECGGQELHIRNQATANLYNYTPYTPNELAQRGYQDECATPSQANFYGFFKAWFGSPVN